MVRHDYGIDSLQNARLQETLFGGSLDVSGQKQSPLSGLNLKHTGCVVSGKRSIRARVQETKRYAILLPGFAGDAVARRSAASRDPLPVDNLTDIDSLENSGHSTRVVQIGMRHHECVDALNASTAEKRDHDRLCAAAATPK